MIWKYVTAIFLSIMMNSINGQCPTGFYGDLCASRSTSFQITYDELPSIDDSVITNKINESLTDKGLKPKRISFISRINNTILVSFDRQINDTDRNSIKSLDIVSDVQDYDECKSGQKCYGGSKCRNVDGSFECVCEGNAKFKDGECLKTDNTKLTIYVWCGAVAGLLLLLMVGLIWYHRKRVKKGNQIRKESYKRATLRKSVSPTNINTLDRATPTGSLNAAYEIGGYRTPYTLPSDFGSEYSYNSGKALTEPGYLNHKLSVPVLDSYPSSEIAAPLSRQRRFMSKSDEFYRDFNLDAESDIPFGTSAPSYNPTAFTTEAKSIDGYKMEG